MRWWCLGRRIVLVVVGAWRGLDRRFVAVVVVGAWPNVGRGGGGILVEGGGRVGRGRRVVEGWPMSDGSGGGVKKLKK